MSPSWENMDDFLDTEDFAVSAIIIFENGTRRPVNGIFDDPYEQASLGRYDNDNERPTFCGKKTDFKDVERGCSLLIGADRYEVLTGPQDDGTGLSVLVLAPA